MVGLSLLPIINTTTTITTTATTNLNMFRAPINDINYYLHMTALLYIATDT